MTKLQGISGYQVSDRVVVAKQLGVRLIGHWRHAREKKAWCVRRVPGTTLGFRYSLEVFSEL